MKPTYNQPTIVFAIGLPASGKTADKHRTYPTFAHLSKDLIRFEEYDFETTGKDFDDKDESRIHRLFLTNLHELVASKTNIFVDNTNHTRAKRAEIIAHMSIDYHIILKVYLVPYFECLRRNRVRKRTVPRECMNRMCREFEMPSYDECLNYDVILHQGDSETKTRI